MLYMFGQPLHLQSLHLVNVLPVPSENVKAQSLRPKRGYRLCKWNMLNILCTILNLKKKKKKKITK